MHNGNVKSPLPKDARRPLVLHDFFLEPDGGGRVASALAEICGGDVVAGEVDKSCLPPEYFHGLDVRSLNALSLRFPPLTRIGKYWRAFACMPVEDRPMSVFSGQLSPLAYSRIHGPKIYYCHTPPRILYDQRDFLLDQATPFFRLGLRCLLPYYRRAFERAARAMDLIVVNSENVRRRLHSFVGMESEVVYPPCGDGFSWSGRNDYYLSTARLDPLKQVDVVIRAFVDMPDKNLIVAGSGIEEERLKTLAGEASNISFAGRVSDSEMRRLVGECTATVYLPRDEDFGMSPVESMAAGKPVIGTAEGGLLETVVHGKTGILLPPGCSSEELIRAVRELDADAAASMRSECEQRAGLFSRETFEKKMLNLMDRVLGQE